jgi:hypothetical protein
VVLAIHSEGHFPPEKDFFQNDTGGLNGNILQEKLFLDGCLNRGFFCIFVAINGLRVVQRFFHILLAYGHLGTAFFYRFGEN